MLYRQATHRPKSADAILSCSAVLPTSAFRLQPACWLQLAEKVITQDLEVLISKAIDTTKSDYAVIAGVQIHSWPLTVGKGPPLDYLWPKAAYAVVNGERRYALLSDLAGSSTIGLH